MPFDDLTATQNPKPPYGPPDRKEFVTRFPAQYNTETMPEDDVDKFLTEQKAVESKRHELIKEVLRQKEAAIKGYDEKLAKLGYDGQNAARRTHHKPEDK